MDIAEIIGKVAEADREAVKAELASYVKVADRDTAEKLAREHPIFKSAVDSFISKAVASHDERFKAETLPKLVDDEVMKRNPPKDPRDVKILEFENKLKDMERAAVMGKQMEIAMAKAVEIGMPIEVVKKCIGLNDDETLANIDALSGPLMAWRDAEANARISGILKDNKTPPKGGDNKQISRADFDKLPLDSKKAIAKTHEIV